MEEQKPTVGRIVLFEPASDDLEARSNSLVRGEKLPAVIVRVWGTSVNLRIFNDGDGVLWRTSVSFGDGPRTWNWPPRG